MREVNQTIIPALGLDLGKTTISENCARRWLKKLGYELTTVKKGIYVDGHECPDVVEYCKTFLAKIAKNEHLRNQYIRHHSTITACQSTEARTNSPR